jgi:RNA polymerase sigma-70 factor (ECF subfamily)
MAAAMSESTRLEALWRESSARLRAWFEREGAGADADDLLQETFARVHERVGTLAEAASARAWLGTIARNVLVDHRRRRGARAELGEEQALAEEPARAAPEASLDALVAGWLAAFVAELEPEDAAALRLVDLEGRPQAELAAREGLSLSGAKSRVQRARARLRERLEACCALAFDARGAILEARRRADGRCFGEPCDGGC